jgi:phosphoglycolate phosphatase
LKRRYDLVIFDWDGTLMDSVGRIVSSMRAAAADAGLNVPTEQAVKGIIGLSLHEVYDILFPGAPEKYLDQLKDAYRQHYVELDNTPTPMFAGALETIDYLKSSGYQIAVATGKARPGLQRVWNEINMNGVFDASRCADECMGKPHPQMVLEILKETRIDPSRSIVVGDTSYDMEMAQRATVDRVAALYGAHHPELLTPYSPVKKLDNLIELKTWLQNH